jgi:hypothetical protein
VTRPRRLLLWAAVAAVAVGAAWALGLRGPPVAEFAIYAGILLLLLLIERVQYKPILKTPPGPPWRETAERFRDPTTGELVAVWVEPGSGHRAYVACAHDPRGEGER